jgi:hypothetical protein
MSFREDGAAALSRGVLFLATSAAVALVPLLMGALVMAWPDAAAPEGERQAAGFIALVLASIALGPVAGWFALAMKRPGVALCLAFLPVAVGTMLLMASG